ncbi:MAG TPA: sugar transferase [Bacteroidales bacterium]|nr:sugar transferase [Bacteroidales bacterium]
MPYNTRLKRGFDIVASTFGLIIISPFLLIIALAIGLEGQGSVIFRQARTGRYGKPFVIYKFRTMKVNSRGNTVTIKGDGRITSVGRILRKFKLDELPELWNVVRGDMSLVGPRPDMPDLTGTLTGEEKLILELRPGVTGPATLKYANEEELLAAQDDPKKFNDEVLWPDKVQINLDYYRSMNLMIDLMIILKTVFRRYSVNDFK